MIECCNSKMLQRSIAQQFGDSIRSDDHITFRASDQEAGSGGGI